ncbi:hypothetical protein LJR164_004523 [Phenylobacterium sp. LjRoot164]|uniref:hypothetical protein n=1 Tax=unclassified Phenylobacterium TaxID=2640670 RepID=UPI003ECE98D0
MAGLVSPLRVGERRRRLALVAAATPGVLVCVLGTHLRHDPLWLAAGLGWIAAVLLACRALKPRLTSSEAAGAAAGPSFPVNELKSEGASP